MSFDLKAGNRTIRREWVRVAVGHYLMTILARRINIYWIMLKLGESFEVLVLGVVVAVSVTIQEVFD